MSCWTSTVGWRTRSSQAPAACASRSSSSRPTSPATDARAARRDNRPSRRPARPYHAFVTESRPEIASNLPTRYAPAEVEGALYERWVERGYFTADVNSDKTPYTIVLPPPNVTGSLHIGHALGHADGRADPPQADAGLRG